MSENREQEPDKAPPGPTAEYPTVMAAAFAAAMATAEKPDNGGVDDGTAVQKRG